jgi:hypothetical protein
MVFQGELVLIGVGRLKWVDWELLGFLSLPVRAIGVECPYQYEMGHWKKGFPRVMSEVLWVIWERLEKLVVTIHFYQ